MSVVGLFVDAENLVYGYLNRFRAKLTRKISRDCQRVWHCEVL